MKLNKLFIAGAMGAVLLMNISCADDYKELNQDPANVTKTMPEGLMTAAINTPVGTRWELLAVDSLMTSQEWQSLAARVASTSTR